MIAHVMFSFHFPSEFLTINHEDSFQNTVEEFFPKEIIEVSKKGMPFVTLGRKYISKRKTWYMNMWSLNLRLIFVQFFLKYTHLYILSIQLQRHLLFTKMLCEMFVGTSDSHVHFCVWMFFCSLEQPVILWCHIKNTFEHTCASQNDAGSIVIWHYVIFYLWNTNTFALFLQ